MLVALLLCCVLVFLLVPGVAHVVFTLAMLGLLLGLVVLGLYVVAYAFDVLRRSTQR